MDDAGDGAVDVTAMVVGTLAQLTHRDPATITPQMRLFADLSFDSTTVLELLLELETELDVLFDPETMDARHVETVGALVEYVSVNVGGAASPSRTPSS
ncbi:phosphopantetheine-binding protein [Micromonospora sp. CPCC 205539]|uniref:phosphopantetheine-binding protein n=1 Tax=Micromonospora sp. CPCC 205539 TaxID=3122408 RepID=UPI002FF043BC